MVLSYVQEKIEEGTMAPFLRSSQFPREPAFKATNSYQVCVMLKNWAWYWTPCLQGVHSYLRGTGFQTTH